MHHLFELEDLPAFPPVLRRLQVEFIGWLVHRAGIYRAVVPPLREALDRCSVREITDLGSGNGGPILFLARQPAFQDVRFLLTDRFPSPAPTGSALVHWHRATVDALDPDPPGTGPLTLFNAFHHFTPAQQEQLVRVHGMRGLLVHEVLQPNVGVFLKILFTTTIGQLLLAPFVRPFRWERLLFTYVLPINLITIPWDGLVSVLRSDTVDRLMERMRNAAPEGCEVRGGTAGPWWAPVTWVHCLPPRAT
jgi:hypothetical protein